MDETIRKCFEEWAKKELKWMDVIVELKYNEQYNNYDDETVTFWWEGWQAAWNILEQKAAQFIVEQTLNDCYDKLGRLL